MGSVPQFNAANTVPTLLPMTLNTAFGPWTSYTPGLTYLTLGTGGGAQNLGWYARVGNVVWYRTALTLGTSGFSVAGFAAVGVPFPVASSNVLTGTAVFLDSSTSTWYPSHHLGSSGTFLAAGGSQGIISGSAPFTWAAGDQIYTVGCYECA